MADRKKSPATEPAFTLTRAMMARLLGLSGQRIKQLADDGVITRLPNGRYGPEAVAQYVEWLRSKVEAKSDYSVLLEQEKWREKKRENDLAEQLVAPVEVLGEVLGRGVAVMIPVLETLPLMVKRHWPEVTGDQTELVKRAVAECRNALADLKIDLDDDEL